MFFTKARLMTGLMVLSLTMSAMNGTCLARGGRSMGSRSYSRPSMSRTYSGTQRGYSTYSSHPTNQFQPGSSVSSVPKSPGTTFPASTKPGAISNTTKISQVGGLANATGKVPGVTSPGAISRTPVISQQNTLPSSNASPIGQPTNVAGAKGPTAISNPSEASQLSNGPFYGGSATGSIYNPTTNLGSFNNGPKISQIGGLPGINPATKIGNAANVVNGPKISQIGGLPTGAGGGASGPASNPAGSATGGGTGKTPPTSSTSTTTTPKMPQGTNWAKSGYWGFGGPAGGGTDAAPDAPADGVAPAVDANAGPIASRDSAPAVDLSAMTMIVGTWTAQPAKDVTLQATFKPDRTFSWTFVVDGKPKLFAGTYTLDGKSLVLFREGNNEKIEGLITLNDPGHFNFKANGSEASDNGLTFAR
jgi:hypothetical protein